MENFTTVFFQCMNSVHLIIRFCADFFMAVNVLLHEDDSYILEKSSSERKSLLQISALKNTYAVQLSNGNSYI